MPRLGHGTVCRLALPAPDDELTARFRDPGGTLLGVCPEPVA